MSQTTPRQTDQALSLLSKSPIVARRDRQVSSVLLTFLVKTAQLSEPRLRGAFSTTTIPVSVT